MKHTKKTAVQAASFFLAMIMFVAGFTFFPQKDMMNSNAASPAYLNWKVGDQYYKMTDVLKDITIPRYYVTAFLYVHAGFRSENESLFNPKTAKTGSYSVRNQVDFKKAECEETYNFSKPGVLSLRADVSSSVNKGLAANTITEAYNKGKYVYLELCNPDSTDPYGYYAVKDISSSGTINLYDPLGSAKTFNDVDLEKDLDLKIWSVEAKNPSNWRTRSYARPTGTYFLKNVTTGEYLNTNGTVRNNCPTISYGKKADNNSYKFIIKNDYSFSVIVPANNTDKYVGNSGSYPSSGVVTGYGPNNNAAWIFEKSGSNYLIHDAHNINIYLGGKDAKWALEATTAGNNDGTTTKASVTTKATTTTKAASDKKEYVLITGKYYLKNNSTGTYLNVEGGKDADKTNIGVAKNAKSKAFIMNITAVTKNKPEAGTHIMPGCSSTRVVNPFADNVTDGINVNLYKKDDTATQKWIWQKEKTGYSILNAQNKKVCLTADGTNVCVKTYSGAKTQIWSIEPVETATTTKPAATTTKSATTTTKAAETTTTTTAVTTSEAETAAPTTETTETAAETATTTTTSAAVPTVKHGDANCDGKVTVADAVAIMQSIGNRDKYGLTTDGQANADVDGVAGITGKDALVIQQVDAGIYKAEDLPLQVNS